MPAQDPQASRSARRELLAIQKRLWRRLKREIDASIVENPPNVEIYQSEYQRDIARYRAVSSKQELVRAAAAADLVYVGDYHTLPHAQKTLVKLLAALSRARPQLILGMEMVHAQHQELLDRFMAGELDEAAFLQGIDYERSWGFPWAPYAEVFALARRRGIRVLGINSDPPADEPDRLLERDFRTARILLEAIRAQPEALVVVFDGDLHVARDHLPLIVDTTLQSAGLPPRRRVIVHQNAEPIYWRLAGRAREREVNVVRLADDAFCVLNASPIEKLQSYLNWVNERETLEPPLANSAWDLRDDADYGLEPDEGIEPNDRAEEYTEQIHRIVQTIARFLELERDDLDAFVVFTVNDLDFLDYLASQGVFRERELGDIKRQILSNESYYIPKKEIIYLSDFSLVNAAEEATHFLHHRASGYSWEQPRDLETDFYFRCMTEALGFFGSKIIVPTRECWQERDSTIFLERHRTRERRRRRRARARARGEQPAPAAGLPPERVKLLHSQRLTLRASRLMLAHRELERSYLETGQWSTAGACLTQPADAHLLLTHMLGHMLGDKLYWGFLQGLIPKQALRRLFLLPLAERGVALATYLDLVELTTAVGHGPDRGERL